MAKTRRGGAKAAKKVANNAAKNAPAGRPRPAAGKASAKKPTASKRRAAPKTPPNKKAAPKKAAPKKAAPKKAAPKKAAPKRAAPKKAAPKKAAPKKAVPAKAPKAAPPAVADLGYSAHPDAGLTRRQLAFLHTRLVEERARKVAGLERHMQEALGEAGVMPDETDMAQRHTEQAYLIRFADKERKLLYEIERALEKLRLGDYGVCEGTEEPIGFKRLELRPWTRYSVAYKEQIERERSQHRR